MTIKIEDYSIKTLVKWSPNPYHFSFDEKEQSTKREKLSKVNSLSEPLGWLFPATLQFKLFLRLLWMDRLGWDDSLSKTLQQQYSLLRLQLKDLESITLPRKVVTPSPKNIYSDNSKTFIGTREVEFRKLLMDRSSRNY